MGSRCAIGATVAGPAEAGGDAVTEADLLAAGWREWPVNPHLDRHDRQWGYTSRDERGKRFHVTVRLWQHSRRSRPDRPVDDGWDAKAQFDSHGDNPTFEVLLLSCRDMTPAQVLAWFTDLWMVSGAAYYELYESDEE